MGGAGAVGRRQSGSTATAIPAAKPAAAEAAAAAAAGAARRLDVGAAGEAGARAVLAEQRRAAREGLRAAAARLAQEVGLGLGSGLRLGLGLGSGLGLGVGVSLTWRRK